MNQVPNKLWSEHEKKRAIISQILEKAKKNQLPIEQKQILFEMINNSNRTEKQKNRFIKFYNLDTANDQNYSRTTLAREYGCTASAIRFSLYSVITYTLLNNDNNMCILTEMIEA